MTRFKKMAELYAELENISSHKKIVEHLSRFFNKIDQKDIKYSAYLALGIIGPKYEKNDLGLGNKLCLEAISKAYGKDKETIAKKFNKEGDLGDTSEYFNKKKTSNLQIKDVFKNLHNIKNLSGHQSQDKKIELLSETINKSSPLESKYIIRVVLGKLRLGFGEKFLIEALANIFTPDKNNAEEIEKRYNLNTDIGDLAESLAKYGMKGIKRFSIKIGRPIKVMLARRVDQINEINKRFPQEMAVEKKYDGERVQIHIDKNIQMFSRRLDDITSQFKELRSSIEKSFKGKKVVLDGEIVYIKKDGSFGSFQELMRRRRKYDVEEYGKKIPVKIYLFDIIYLNGKSLMKKPYPERRKLLEKNIRPNKKVKFAERIVTSEFDEMEHFFHQSIKEGLEGVIVKSTDHNSFYEPGNRGFTWIKWKKEYAEGSRDTFDLLVIGSYYGQGRRKDVFGALLCALKNKKDDSFESFTKVGSGFDDEQFKILNKKIKKNTLKKKPSDVIIEKTMMPDIFVKPDIVIEVIGAEITRSEKHSAGKNTGEKGYALRFPRFLRIRQDKGPEDITTLQEMKQIL